jgi:hypothetical protein
MHKEAELSFFSIKKQRTSYGNTSSIPLCKAPKHSLFSPKYKACKLIYVVLPFLPSHACSRGAPSLLHKIVRCPQPMIFFLKKRDANWLCPRHGIHGEQGRDIGLAGTPKWRRAGGVYWWWRQLRRVSRCCSLAGASSWRVLSSELVRGIEDFPESVEQRPSFASHLRWTIVKRCHPCGRRENNAGSKLRRKNNIIVKLA